MLYARNAQRRVRLQSVRQAKGSKRPVHSPGELVQTLGRRAQRLQARVEGLGLLAWGLGYTVGFSV